MSRSYQDVLEELSCVTNMRQLDLFRLDMNFDFNLIGTFDELTHIKSITDGKQEEYK